MDNTNKGINLDIKLFRYCFLIRETLILLRKTVRLADYQ